MKKNYFRFLPLLLVGVSSLAHRLLYYNIPISIFFSIIFIGSYLILLMPSLKTHRNTYIKDIKYRWNYSIMIKIIYFIYLFLYLISTLFGEYTHHYLTSVLYCQFMIIISIFIFDCINRYKETILFLSYGFFILGIIMSFLIDIFFILKGRNFVRTIDMLESTFGIAGQYVICIAGIISGLILLSFEIENFEKYKSIKKNFNSKILLIVLGLILILSAVILSGGRYNLIISFIMIVSYFYYFLKRSTIKIKIKTILITFLLFFSIFCLFQNQINNLTTLYLARFVNFSSNDYKVIFFGGGKRTEVNDLFISKISTVNLMGKGRGYAEGISLKYLDMSSHSAYFNALFDVGIIGLFLYILVILLILFLGFKKKGYFGINIFSIGFFLLTYSFFGHFFSDIFLVFLISLSIGIYNLPNKNVI